MDVFKHGLYVHLVESFFHKESPLAVFDLYAGEGLYAYDRSWPADLQACFKEHLPSYFEQINSFLIRKLYPGSVFALALSLRPQDRLLACEWVEDIFSALQQNVLRNQFKPKIKLQQAKAEQCWKSVIPPLEKRGLVLFDPPFEHPQEYDHLVTHLEQALKKWEKGVYSIWYPLKDINKVNRFLRQIKGLTQVHGNNVLKVEIGVAPPNLFKLDACGMLIINAPWRLEERIKPWLEALIKTQWYGKQSYYEISQ